jgi:hypothetical protein
MVGKSKNTRRTAERFYNFPQLLWVFNKRKQKHSSSEEINGNCDVFANSRWAILPALLLANSGNLGISQRLSNTL